MKSSPSIRLRFLKKGLRFRAICPTACMGALELGPSSACGIASSVNPSGCAVPSFPRAECVAAPFTRQRGAPRAFAFDMITHLHCNSQELCNQSQQNAVAGAGSRGHGVRMGARSCDAVRERREYADSASNFVLVGYYGNTGPDLCADANSRGETRRHIHV
jgi:hypothetical protein